MKRSYFVYVIQVSLISILFLSCSKNDDKGDGVSLTLTGHIYHQYTSDVMKIDMRTGQETSFFSYSAYSTVGWDLSRDGKLRIVSTREPGTYDRNLFTIVNTANDQIIKSFEYVPRNGNSTRNTGKISFDNSMILVAPDAANGIAIMDMDGDIKYEMTGIGDEPFSTSDDAYWLPDNNILVRFQNKLLRSAPPYNNLTLVKEMNYEKWGNVRISNNGQKISMYINKHIFLMDANGSNLVQVTDSNGDEAFGEFSPDDKFLLVGSDYFHAPASGNSHWFLKVIPADGKKYNMDSDQEVISVIPTGETSIVRANGTTVWRQQ
ncbi:hypothetical protein [Sphingobacterium sp. FBM7-1]|uniref:hypothetical protein n=1 Tax=Sphingobacterium sp. FBM7-1 TaxID=2886688 RepID=UPI001D102FF1|nr:hypothetical protein [Sphingobacterium sp. FBM7-1]MCC2598519.1 hypothetical protein [Sphingobacterium sp. FBM7-1]